MVDRDDEESQPGRRPVTPLAAALWTTALWLLQGVVLNATEAVRPGAGTDVVNQAACIALATSVVVFAMVRVHARDVSLRATLGVAAPAPLHVLLAAAAGAGMFPLFSTVEDLMQKRWPLAQGETEDLGRLLSVPTSGARIGLVLAVLVVIPVAHELFFRGILYGEVKRATNVRTATIASAVFFAASQLDWRTLPTMLALGLALARLRERTGTVLAPVAAHCAYWAVFAVPVARGADPLADVTYPTRWIVGGAVIAALALAAVGAGRREE